MARLSLIASTVALTFAFCVSAAHAAPTITAIKKAARDKITTDAKAWMKKTGYDKSLDRPKVKVEFEPVHCGTPPVTVRCIGRVCAFQGSPVPPLPGFPNPKTLRPWALADFNATGAVKSNKVSVHRVGAWRVSPPCIARPR